MVIGDHELDTAESSGPQSLEESGPKGPVLAVADLDAEHLPVPWAVTPVAITTALETTRPRTRPFT